MICCDLAKAPWEQKAVHFLTLERNGQSLSKKLYMYSTIEFWTKICEHFYLCWSPVHLIFYFSTHKPFHHVRLAIFWTVNNQKRTGGFKRECLGSLDKAKKLSLLNPGRHCDIMYRLLGNMKWRVHLHSCPAS